MRLLIVDDHEIVREGLVSALAPDPRYEVVAAVATAGEAMRWAKRTVPEVALVDLRLPDMTGTDLSRALRSVLPSIRVIVLTSYLSEETVKEAIDAGAVAYVTKAAGLSELRRVLDEVSRLDRGPAPQGPSQIVRRLHDLASSHFGIDVPTPQQQQVLDLAAQGLTNDAIGARLYISESTVRFHLQNMKTKLGARSKTELIARAIRAGIIAPANEDPPSPAADIPRDQLVGAR
jgi:DNA-binding NarL/FixJ family response regulator